VAGVVSSENGWRRIKEKEVVEEEKEVEDV